MVMKTVVLDGVQYTKASVVAERFKYTSDYIGQLCRAKKIDARLVGRTWFVNEESLVAHKKSKHQKSAPTEQTARHRKPTQVSDTTSDTKTYRINVNAPLKNKTIKSLPDKPLKVASSDRKESVQIRYETDSEHLFPTVVKKSNAQTESNSVKKYLHIEPASAKKLKIKAHKTKPSAFKTTELPDVALSGKLAISSYESQSQTDGDAPQESREVAPVKTAPVPKTITKKPVQTTSEIKSDQSLSKVAGLPEPPVPLPTWQRISPLLGTLLAAAVSILLLSVSSEVLVSDVLATSKLTIQLEKFAEIFTR
jgi:hypothetical protein